MMAVRFENERSVPFETKKQSENSYSILKIPTAFLNFESAFIYLFCLTCDFMLVIYVAHTADD